MDRRGRAISVFQLAITTPWVFPAPVCSADAAAVLHAAAELRVVVALDETAEPAWIGARLDGSLVEEQAFPRAWLRVVERALKPACFREWVRACFAEWPLAGLAPDATEELDEAGARALFPVVSRAWLRGVQPGYWAWFRALPLASFPVVFQDGRLGYSVWFQASPRAVLPVLLPDEAGLGLLGGQLHD